MKLSQSTLALVLCLSAAHTEAAILTGPLTNSSNGHLYYLLAPNTWTNCEAEAVSLGGHLATINDQAENDWVVANFSTFDGVPRHLWIGLTDRDEEGIFIWVSGETSTYRNWAPGEPNNGAGTPATEQFAHILSPAFRSDGTWNDNPDFSQYSGVIEVDPIPSLHIRVSQVELCWDTRSNVIYQLQSREAITNSPWISFGGPFLGDGTRFCTNDWVLAGQRQRYYQLVVTTAP